MAATQLAPLPNHQYATGDNGHLNFFFAFAHSLQA